MNGPGARAAWALALPLRLYMRQDVVTAGRSLVYKLLSAIVDRARGETFLARLPGERVAELHFRETVGRSYLIFGGYEHVEVAILGRYAVASTTAVDVGANVGLLTIALADGVGASGAVWACEPVPSNVARLRRNIELNDLAQVEVIEVALGDATGSTPINLADDPAFHSVGDVFEGRSTGRRIDVPLARLDDLWEERGRPSVSVVKIDTEGTETAVLRGAVRLIRACKPCLVVEAPHTAPTIAAFLQPYGYQEFHVRGFHSATHVFVSGGARSPT